MTSTGAGDGEEIEDLNKLEAAFFTSGYEAGFDHGKAHGIFEGRALGQEKGFETFEELYYYAGQARFWQAVSLQNDKKKKAMPHLLALLTMIDNFPQRNSIDDTEPEHDTGKLLHSIRTKYKVMCASLGIRPRIQKAEAGL